MTDPAGVALILTPISVVAVAVINVWNGRRVTQVHALAKEGLRVGQQIDAAVNGKAPGEPSIAADVRTVLDKQETDNPSTPVNGEAMRPLLANLTKLVEELKRDVADLRNPGSTGPVRDS